MANPLSGLTAAEVADRVRRGLGNRSPRSELRDYALIAARNFLTGFNAMVAPAAVLLFVLHDYRAAVAVSGMAVVNTLLSLIQEVRAKFHLDRLSLLTESKVRVRRDGDIVELPSGDVVQDDCILLQPGDTVVADGPLLESQFVEIDEALLTGESDPVRRNAGERVLSGSICVAGEGAYRAEAVGAAAFAQKTSTQARRYHVASSPLTRSINRIVRLLSYTAIGLCIIHFVGWRYLDVPTDDAVRRVAATITTMVPQGLILSATLAFIVGALAMGRRGAIVQRLSAVETMAAIDIVCTDKTGTLTTNQLKLDFVQALGESDEESARHALRQFAAASIDRNNRNVQAIQAALGAMEVEALDHIPFKSRNRYSAVRVASDGPPRLLVLGAIEALRDKIAGTLRVPSAAPAKDESPPSDAAAHGACLLPFDDLVRKSQESGLRLLLFAEGQSDVSLANTAELPAGPLQPLALLGLADELRPDAGRVLEALNVQGIQFKVISGDNPETVQGAVRHIDLPIARDAVVTGDQLMSAADRVAFIRDHGVFGRVAPDQKLLIVETLQLQGHRVAMIGDGVNDVLTIKRADLGIAMGSGSSASKTVAGLVLEGDRFEVLPDVLEEGRAIVRNLRRGAKLFLVKNVYSLMLILASYAGLGLPFPYVPQQVTLLNWSVIGIPALAIAMSRQRADRVSHTPFVREVLSFAIRTGVVFGVGGILILWHATHLYPDEERTQRTLFLSMLILLGITALFRALTDGEPPSAGGDRTFRLLGLLAIPVYLLAMYVPLAQSFFELAALGVREWLIVLLYAAACWGATVMLDWSCTRRAK
jgi:cation-transporting ATPase E